MTAAKSIPELEKLIGYQFKDKDVIEKARTRLAHLNDQRKCDEKNSMGPLATLGDAVLSCVVAYKLYADETNRTRQKITEIRIKSVRHERTKKFASTHELAGYVLWGKGEKIQEIDTSGTKADDMVTEALIGAVFLDAEETSGNGLKVVEDMLDRLGFFN
jgi:dsRNA-specific ribonuclease